MGNDLSSATSPRIECPHERRCGGCPLIALPYDEQLASKGDRVTRAVRGYPELSPVVTLPVLGADPITGYRARAKLVVAPGGRIGLYERGPVSGQRHVSVSAGASSTPGWGHEVTDIPACQVLSSALALVADALRSRVKRDEATGGGLAHLRAVDLRQIEPLGDLAKVLVTLVVERSPQLRLESLRQAAQELAQETPSIVGVAVNFHDGVSPRILGSETVRVYGHGAQVATFGAFAQAHRGQEERIHELIARVAFSGVSPQGRPLRVLDLYGGSGAIALSLASRGVAVTLVESFEPAVVHAKAAAARQGVALEAFAQDAEAALTALLHRKRGFDLAVVNPPRRGMSPGARSALAKLDTPLVTYVSCDPDTLARDLAHLALLGFRGKELQPVDMIPLTDHVEILAVLRRGEPPAPSRLFEDDEVLAVAKSPHEPTTPQGEHETSLLGRVRRFPSADSAVPVHRLDVGTSGAVLFARAPSFVHAWSLALGAPSAHKVYLALVKGGLPETGTIELPIHGRRHASGSAGAWSAPEAETWSTRGGKRRILATTNYRRVESLGKHTLVEVRPEQGRTHQIRRHFAGIGHPVLGDDRYGHPSSNRHFEEKHGLDRAFLHCARIELTHPRTGRAVRIEAPLAADLEAVLARLRGVAKREEVSFG